MEKLKSYSHRAFTNIRNLALSLDEENNVIRKNFDCLKIRLPWSMRILQIYTYLLEACTCYFYFGAMQFHARTIKHAFEKTQVDDRWQNNIW